MKILFRPLSLLLVLFGTTFCSKDHQPPTPVATGTTATSNMVAPGPGYPYPSTPPIGFNSNCSADPNGIDTPLYNEARNNAYRWDGTVLSEADFITLKTAASSNQGPVVDANGHISGATYASRVNNFSDGVKQQMDEYNYYVYWASLHGSDVQNAEDVKGIIQEQFDYTIPAQPGESLSPTDQANIALMTAAARPQLAHSLALFSSLYQCEGVNYRPAVGKETAKQASGEVVSFKDFLKLRKAGRIMDAANEKGYVAQRGFWSFLKKAVNIVVSVVIYTLVGLADGPRIANAACGSPAPPSCTTAAYIIAAAGGFINGIIKVANGNCVFGGC